jgi:hypothetical protein
MARRDKPWSSDVVGLDLWAEWRFSNRVGAELLQ